MDLWGADIGKKAGAGHGGTGIRAFKGAGVCGHLFMLAFLSGQIVYQTDCLSK
jgi:hypothetical protein